MGESAEVRRANERRQTTRAALAKKLLNKKIVANERKRFDDDGNVSPDFYSTRNSITKFFNIPVGCA